MKTVTFTDKELRELGGLLNSAISECLDDSLITSNKEEKHRAINQSEIYKKIYNKLINSLYKVKK